MLLQSDTVLPVQFLNARRGPATAEQLLMTAVLEDAIHCFQRHLFAKTNENRRLFREAEEWMMGREQSSAFFSFSNICDTLGVDPDYLRCGLQQWRLYQLETAKKRSRRAGAPAAAKRSA